MGLRFYCDWEGPASKSETKKWKLKYCTVCEQNICSAALCLHVVPVWIQVGDEVSVFESVIRVSDLSCPATSVSGAWLSAEAQTDIMCNLNWNWGLQSAFWVLRLLKRGAICCVYVNVTLIILFICVLSVLICWSVGSLVFTKCASIFFYVDPKHTNGKLQLIYFFAVLFVC